MTLAYVGNRLDRCANLRGNSEWLDGQCRSDNAKFVRIVGDQTVLRDGKLETSRVDGADLSVFLGLDDSSTPWFACKTPEKDGLVGLRAIAMECLLNDDEIGILAQARSLIHWHERRSFCSNCGGRNELADGGYRRHCEACGADHFPRTDPVVIIVVRHGTHILLGRQAAWAPGMYSALAGFMEPGETIEDAARREVHEEAGIRVGAVCYVASQPWPFPASLMIGLIGEAMDSTIRLDEKELDDARWFSAEDRRHPDGLYAANPMAIAHHLVRLAVER